MKKILIATALLASASLLSGCGSSETKPTETMPTGIVKTTKTLETTWAIGITGNDETTKKIQALIETRKTQLATETWDKKQLNEKDIKLLEEVLNAMTKKK